MTPQVFLSYAHYASRDHAVAIRAALARQGVAVFLDTEEIDSGERFPERIVDGLLGARVVVVLAEPVYFTRWYCLLEFRAAREPFMRAVERSLSATEREDALTPLVLALAPGAPGVLDRFPPDLRGVHWPLVTDPEGVARLVRERLDGSDRTLAEWMAHVAMDPGVYRDSLLGVDRLPRPRKPGSIPMAPAVGLPLSIGDAFVGRADDLWRIHDLLTTRHGDGLAAAPGVTGVVAGGGGYGKTRLVAEYLHRYGPEHFTGGLFWISAERDPEPQQYEILEVLDPAVPPFHELKEAKGQLQARLARALRGIQGKRALVVLDNLPEPAAHQAPEPLTRWVPAPDAVAMLVTSRLRVRDASVVLLEIDVLGDEDALRLLARNVDRGALADGEWREIVAWVGNLPLALELLNASLQHLAFTPARLLGFARGESTTDRLDEAEDALRGVVAAESLRGVTRAFLLSFLALSQQAGLAARILAFLAPEPIPEELIDAFGEEFFPPRVRVELRSRSFVSPVESGASRSFGRMHRVLADFLRCHSQVAVLPTLVAVTITRLMHERCEAPGEWPRMNALLPHAEEAFSRVESTGDPELGRMVVRLGTSIGTLLHEQGFFSRALDFRVRTMNAGLRLLGDEHPETLSTMNSLATTYHAHGDATAARALGERVLQAQRRVLGKEHPNTLSTMANLAAIHGREEESPERRVLQEQALEAQLRILGEQHPSTLVTMNNVALAYADRGDLANARTLQDRVVEAIRRVQGEEHPDTLTALHNLAHILSRQGDLAGARTLLERTAGTRRRVLGEAHPDTLSSMTNLALVYFDEGDLSSARTLQERLLQLRRQSLEEEHPGNLQAMFNLAVTYRELGDLARATELLERVLAGRRRVLGLRHPDTSIAAWNLWNALRMKGDDEDAGDIHAIYLAWLLTADSESLSAKQRTTRDHLRASDGRAE